MIKVNLVYLTQKRLEFHHHEMGQEFTCEISQVKHVTIYIEQHVGLHHQVYCQLPIWFPTSVTRCVDSLFNIEQFMTLKIGPITKICPRIINYFAKYDLKNCQRFFKIWHTFEILLNMVTLLLICRVFWSSLSPIHSVQTQIMPTVLVTFYVRFDVIWLTVTCPFLTEFAISPSKAFPSNCFRKK